MVDGKATEPPTEFPKGYRAIPILKDQGSPLRLCVLACQNPDPVTGHFVLLRDLPDARVYLGCVTDAKGAVREWIELWVQSLEGLQGSLPTYRETLSNHTLDGRWTQLAAGLRQVNPASLIQTGWETVHPPPTFLDFSENGPVPIDATAGGEWELCRDDGLLLAAGLPPYSTSLYRYLYQPSTGKASCFVPVVAGAPQNQATRPLTEVVGDSAALPFNPQGGLMIAAEFFPIGYEDYADLLGGKPWSGVALGKQCFPLDGVYRSLQDWGQVQQQGAHLFLGGQGLSGRIVETFHLKLQLLLDALRLVRASVQQHQLPFLNLAADSFRVKLETVGAKLPFFWTAQGALVKPSSAFALPVQSSDFRYFIRARSGGTSIYLPEGISSSLQGNGSVRIRKVFAPEQGRTVIEGTLVIEERLAVSPRDLLWIRLPLPSGRVDLYGHLYSAEGLAQGEARFRTLPLQLPDATVKALSSAEGVSFARSPFEAVPLLSSPCDLYALGVLATRTLLVNDEVSLAIALDETLSLARQVATEHDPAVPLGQRISRIFRNEARYAASLGPHRLLRESVEPKKASDLLPEELWFDILGCIVRMFPGMGPDSVCRDYGDAPSLALESVFNNPLQELETLLVRSRSLILIDWHHNREILSVIQNFIDRQKG